MFIPPVREDGPAGSGMIRPSRLRIALRRPPAALLAALIALPSAAAPADLRAFDETAAAVRRRFQDRTFNGLDWDRHVASLRPRAAACESPRDLIKLVNRGLLAPLQASHTVLIEGDVFRNHFEPELQGRTAPGTGLELGRFPEGLFVTAVHDNSPAARAAIELGERLLAVNGLPPEDSLRLADAGSDPGVAEIPRHVLRVEPGRPVDLLLQSAPGALPRCVPLWTDETSQAEATRDSARTVRRDGRTLAILHPWHFMSWSVVRSMREALKGPLAEAEGLVLDLRGRGGQVPVTWGALWLFTPRADGTRFWDKPAVALIDASSRSAKEVFAWHWRRMGAGPLVGRRTAGAVLGSQFVRLSDGSVLQLAVADVSHLTAGEQLEGVGIDPDVPVDGALPWCRGRDAILEKGLAVLIEELRKASGGERSY